MDEAKLDALIGEIETANRPLTEIVDEIENLAGQGAWPRTLNDRINRAIARALGDSTAPSA